MTDDDQPDPTDGPATGEDDAAAIAGAEGIRASADSSSEGSLGFAAEALEEVGDSIKWMVHKVATRNDHVETTYATLDIEQHEESATRSSTVSHDDPPPPAPGDQMTHHVTEHSDR